MGRRSRAGDPEPREANSDAPGAARLPWGMDSEEMQPSSLAALTDDKLARFVLGQQKKTKFEKEREEREARKRKADAEAAEIYADFVASFDDEDDRLGKRFVRAEGNSAGGSGAAYRLKPKLPVASAFAGAADSEPRKQQAPGQKKRMSEMDRMLEEMKQKDQERQQRREQHNSYEQPRKRRAIDEFLEEMKERGPSGTYVDEEGRSISKGSFDAGDPDTTNLYVGNLAPTVTEELLQREFGRYGKIYSVKIMWPRSEEERARRRNCGFVSFFTRTEADSARVNLHNKELEGQPMIVGWGKAVKIDHSLRTSGSTLPAASILSVPVAPTPGSVALVSSVTPSQQSKRVVIEIPSSKDTKDLVDRLAKYVAADGLQFENAIRAREAGNPSYRFLFETNSPDALYYRWRVYSFAMGDKEHEWRVEPFQMSANGSVWVPPPIPKHYRSRSRSRSRDSRRNYPDSPRRNRHRSPSRSPSRSRSHSRRRSRSRSRSRSRRRNDSLSRSSHRGNDREDQFGRRARSYSSGSGYSSSPSPRRQHHRSNSQSRSPKRHDRYDRRSQSRSRSRSPSRNWNTDKNWGSHEPSDSARIEKFATGQQIARARELESGREPNRLPQDAYDELQDLLADLTLERESVKRVMGFALDNSEAAVDIVNILREAFHRREDSSAVALVGLLFVASDILHNSSAAVKNASLFRTTFQDCLPEIMNVLRASHKNIVGRMSANVMKDKVLSVLTAWESWSLFPPGYLVGLNATFLRKIDEVEFMESHNELLKQVSDKDEERLRKACKQAGILSSGSAKELFARLQWLKEFTSPVTSNSTTSATPPSRPTTVPQVERNTVPTESKKVAQNSAIRTGESSHEDLDGEPMENDTDELDGEPMDELDLEGNTSGPHAKQEPANDDDIDGIPMDEDDQKHEDIDGEPLDGEENLDGVPLDEDLDGEPLDEDLDGEPLDEELDGAPLDEDLDGEPL